MRKTCQVAGGLLFVGLVAWAIFSGWKYLLVRRAATAMQAAIESEWPDEAAPSPGTRQRLLAATVHMHDGDFGAIVHDLDAEATLSDEQRAAGQRFLERQRLLKEQFAAVAEEARAVEQEGGDVHDVRIALSRALIAAAREDRAATALQIEIAQAALDAGILGHQGNPLAGEDAVTGLLDQVGPSYLVGRELMTEGHDAVNKLLVRARRHYEEKEFLSAASLVRLAAQLSGVEPSPTAADAPPEWFLDLDLTDLPTAEKATATSAVELCRSMATAAEPSEPVRALIRSAQRELRAGRFDEALWWATVGLNALGLSDQEIESAVQSSVNE